MPTTIFTVIRTRKSSGKLREHYVSLPLVTVLLDEPGFKYLPTAEPEPPAPGPIGPCGAGRRRESTLWGGDRG
jgi:hypothetical protein